jgi:DNA-binding NarL/FixJ family response regulator
MENFPVTSDSKSFDPNTHLGMPSGSDGEVVQERFMRPRPEDENLDTRPVGVLIIDDNRLNGVAIRRSFTALQVFTAIFEVRTCGEALDALHGMHSRMNALPPCILLLNLDMPESFEFLKVLRSSNHSGRNAVIFVHSKSNSIANHTRAYDWNIAGYIHDRPGRKSLLSLARLLREYIRAVELPDHDDSSASGSMLASRTPGFDVSSPLSARPSSGSSHPERAGRARTLAGVDKLVIREREAHDRLGTLVATY